MVGGAIADSAPTPEPCVRAFCVKQESGFVFGERWVGFVAWWMCLRKHGQDEAVRVSLGVLVQGRRGRNASWHSQ